MAEPSARRRRPPAQLSTAAGAALLLAALAALFYLPLLLGVATFPDGDFTHHFLPFSLFQQSELLSGRLPRWNPYTYGGHPFLADIQAAVYYPVSNLVLGLTLPWTAPGVRLYFLQVEAIVHVALAGFFTWLLLSALTGSRWAALVAGALFAFSGYLTGYPPLQLAVLRTAIWLPLLLWLLLRAVAAPQQWRWWLGSGTALAVAFFGGHAQTFLYLLYVAAGWFALLLVWRWRAFGNERSLPALAFGLLAGGLVAAGLGAAQALPSLEFTRLSVRAAVDYEFVSGGFPLQDSWQLLLPAVLTQYSPLYIGVVGLGLAWLGGCSLFRDPYRARPADPLVTAASHATRNTQHATGLPHTYALPFFLAVALLALLLSYGANGFLYPFFYHFAPGWKLFRGQERAAYLVTFSLCVVAGYGVATIPAMTLRWRSLLATIYAAFVVGGTYLFGLLWQFPGRTALGQGAFLLVAAVTVTLVSAWAVLLRWPGWSRRRSFWLAVLAVGNLFWAGMGTNLTEFSPARRTLLPPEVAALQAAAAETGADRLPGRVYNEFRVYEDYGMRAGVEDVWGASPLRLARYAALFEAFPLDRMWQLLGVEHVLTWRRELFGPSQLLGEWPQATDTTYLHQLPDPAPRAWLATATQVVADDEALRLLADHEFDLQQTVLLPPEVATGGANTGDATEGSVEMRQLAPGHLAFEIQGNGGMLVIAENWMPGWQVESIQCEDAPAGCAPGVATALGLPAFAPVRANLTLLGVPVPAGVLRFELVYRPTSIALGLWSAAATLALLMLAAVVRRLARRPSRDIRR